MSNSLLPDPTFFVLRVARQGAEYTVSEYGGWGPSYPKPAVTKEMLETWENLGRVAGVDMHPKHPPPDAIFWVQFDKEGNFAGFYNDD